jgi:hypothetical protein
MNRLKKTLKAISELGLQKLWYYARYKVGLITGHYRRMTPFNQPEFTGEPGLSPIEKYPRISKAQLNALLAEAEHICNGQVRLFGGELVPLDLEAGASDLHWTVLEKVPPEGDIKFIWEPGRFGWAITLARAYALSGDDRYAEDFWKKAFHFLRVHPANRGRQWQSAQEVAIRLMSLVFCDRVLADAPSSTLENRARLWQAVADHAARIVPTLVYARAQNNNHLLSEAAGLFTAGCYLPDHPQAAKWWKVGWRWLNWGFLNQINEFGTYIQHSVNYHRLMLQVALFTDHLRREVGELVWPSVTLERLGSAQRWLWALTDHESGRVPNLGANDRSYIFPLTQQVFDDFRPVVDAAAKAFLGQDIFAQPDLAEMAGWFDLNAPDCSDERTPQAADMLRIEREYGRAFIRAAHFNDRPSHADQLHTDLWWRGVNIAGDPGTYLYNAPPPWENSLSGTQVHNTLTLDGQDQMQRAGRFLWLGWAQADILAHEVDGEGRLKWVRAEHDGYRRLGALHRRTLSAVEDGWIITDEVLPYGRGKGIHEVRLSWLLPDWDWQFEDDDRLRLTGPEFTFSLTVSGAEQLNLFSAGEPLQGNLEAQPAWGWTSPTYGIKEPALLLITTVVDELPIKLESAFHFYS